MRMYGDCSLWPCFGIKNAHLVPKYRYPLFTAWITLFAIASTDWSEMIHQQTPTNEAAAQKSTITNFTFGDTLAST